MKKHIFKIGFVACLAASAIFAVLLVSNSIILSSITESGLDILKYMNLVKAYTILLFVSGIGVIVFKSLDICTE